MAAGVIEILVFLGFVLPLCWWQFRDLEKAKQETARKRAAEAAQKQAELEAQAQAQQGVQEGAQPSAPVPSVTVPQETPPPSRGS